MERINELRAARAALLERMAAINEAAEKENRDLNEAEAKEFNDCRGKAASFLSRIERAVDLHRLETAGAAPIGSQATNPNEKRGGFNPYQRYRTLVAFKGANAEERAYRCGMWLRASLYDHAPAINWCKEAGMQIVTRAQAEASDASGGVFVPEELVQTIIDLREQFGVARRLVDVLPMARDTMVIPRRTGGVTAYFVGEGKETTASQAAWDAVRFTARKLAALVLMSTELSDDATINLADYLAAEIAYSFAEKEDDCLFNGTGTSSYGAMTGVLTKIIDGTHTASVVDAASGHDTFAEIDAADLANTMAKLPQFALARARWYISQPGFQLVFGRLAQAAGGNTMRDLEGRVQYQYLGYPIEISQKMPTTTSTINGTPVLLFGDMGRAVGMGVRRDVGIRRSEERYFELDSIGILGTERFDINAHSLGSTTAAGPLIALNGKS